MNPDELFHPGALRFPALRLIAFDLDGTLVDSKRDLVESVNAMLHHMHREKLPAEVIASYVGQGVRTLVARSLGGDSEIETGLAFFLDYYRAHMLDHTRPYPGVLDCLEELRGEPLAILTNKPVRFSRSMLQGLRLDGFFMDIRGGDSFPTKKPDPAGLREMMAQAGARAEETLMVGDSETDILTGKNAGAWTCGVTYGFGGASLAQHAPDLILDNLRDLPQCLTREPMQIGRPAPGEKVGESK